MTRSLSPFREAVDAELNNSGIDETQVQLTDDNVGNVAKLIGVTREEAQRQINHVNNFVKAGEGRLQNSIKELGEKSDQAVTAGGRSAEAGRVSALKEAEATSQRQQEAVARAYREAGVATQAELNTLGRISDVPDASDEASSALHAEQETLSHIPNTSWGEETEYS